MKAQRIHILQSEIDIHETGHAQLVVLGQFVYGDNVGKVVHIRIPIESMDIEGV